MHRTQINNHYLQPLLPPRNQQSRKPTILLPSLSESQLFEKYLQPKLQGISTQAQIEQFLPFDPTIIQIFDEQDLCSSAMLTDLIVPSSSYMLGNSYFGGWYNQVERVSNIVYSLMKQANHIQEWYVRVFVRIPTKQNNTNTVTTLYKTYIVNIKKPSQLTNMQLVINQYSDQRLPFDINIQYASIGPYRISAIVLQQHLSHPHSYLLAIQIQTDKANKIYQIQPSTNKITNIGSISCDNMDVVIRQLVLMQQQLTTFYNKEYQTMISQLVTYDTDATYPHFNYQLITQKQWSKNRQYTLESQHILQLSQILTHYHNLGLSLSNLDFVFLTPTIIIFSNFTNTEPIQYDNKQAESHDPSSEIIYDILCLITNILDREYTGPHCKTMEHILYQVVDPKEVLQRWDSILQSIRTQVKQIVNIE